ncbi:MAG TPA: aldo/keto reductase [Pelagibacterium sp.]|uniref:aldo/keto reductase n=1 Tax=uncultured Pelagibacterium sp. TaxID=1159875 RepID=UPI000C4F1B78|nr:aldo/keto reductase [Pelagibacterium sp.]HCO56060.1 aldo/keto reductase [Pelagibacterium sp.]|tara:strand:- start:1136 stop:2173 length:1038 start_codon:yes stop_codon:yes gene_type:complete
MQQRTLGRTGISVSRICLGSMTWGEQNTEAEGHAQMDYALDNGVNFLDTAELYSTPGRAETQGSTETIIGNWFAANGRRADWVLASKIAGPGNAWIRDGRPMDGKQVVLALEANLKRLKTDYIDLYQLHWPNREHYNFSKSWTFDPYGQDRQAIRDNLLEVLEALGAQVKAGKIRAIGLSNETSWGTSEYIKLAETHGLPRMATIQNEYNLVRRHFDHDLAEVCAFEDVDLLAYSPLAGGLLSGKYNDGQMPAGTRGALGTMWRLNPQSETATKAYIELAQQHGLDVCQMAIAWCLTRPFMGSVIIGATSMDQLKSNIAAHDLVLSPQIIAAIADLHRLYPRTVA